ncbi:hypothetical protein RF11_03195 [Thelohanellus kitauei]|uniref:Uncharacterized protein n=1 Tax=Thelohanellus kitauei TaxID=669202 RepID=A0A0C2IUN4_THEKT|nr:hypothetical protein RF11_03195 [Thelohanellus kitauei]
MSDGVTSTIESVTSLPKNIINTDVINNSVSLTERQNGNNHKQRYTNKSLSSVSTNNSYTNFTNQTTLIPDSGLSKTDEAKFTIESVTTFSKTIIPIQIYNHSKPISEKRSVNIHSLNYTNSSFLSVSTDNFESNFTNIRISIQEVPYQKSDGINSSFESVTSFTKNIIPKDVINNSVFLTEKQIRNTHEQSYTKKSLSSFSTNISDTNFTYQTILIPNTRSFKADRANFTIQNVTTFSTNIIQTNLTNHSVFITENTLHNLSPERYTNEPLSSTLSDLSKTNFVNHSTLIPSTHFSISDGFDHDLEAYFMKITMNN